MRTLRIPHLIMAAALVLLVSWGVDITVATASKAPMSAPPLNDTTTDAILIGHDAPPSVDGVGQAAAFDADAPLLDSEFSPIDAGVYRLAADGTELSVDIVDSYWLIQTNNDSVTVFTDPGPSGPIGRDLTLISPSRLVDPSGPGVDDAHQEGWPVGDIDGWLDNVIGGVVISNRIDTTLGGRPSAQFDVHLTDDVDWEGSAGVGFVTTRHGDRVTFAQGRDYRVWWIDGDVGEAMTVIVSVATTEHSFLEQAEELLDTLAFGPSAIIPTS